MTTHFDPSRALVFDLTHGQLRDDEGTARLNIPALSLLRLCEQAGTDAQKDFARSLGTDIGRRIADRLGRSASDAPLHTWASHLGGHLALVGLGDLSLQLWGQALVISVAGIPTGGTQLVGHVLSAALQRGLGKTAELVAFEQESSTSFLVVSSSTASKVSEMISNGVSLGEVIERLHKGAA